MDARTLKLLNNIDDFMRNPPPGVPEQLLDEINNTREMLTAPRFSGESPGEREARQVAEATMPPDVAEKYYGDSGETDNNNIGVFN